MDRLLKINGKTYKAIKIDVNVICDFEDSGLPLNQFGKKMFSTARLYTALSMNKEVEEAGIELSEHIKDGGSLEDIYQVIYDEMAESGFFPKEPERAEETTTTRKGKKRAEKSEDEEVTS